MPARPRFQPLAAAVAIALTAANIALAADPEPAAGTSNTITFEMPRDGWATVAINDAQGARVRNLLGDMPFTKGRHTIEWDGCDDSGKQVSPGSYRWVGLYHGDMHAVYRGSFQYGQPPWLFSTTGGWTADHSSAEALATVGDHMLIGSPESEAGHGLIAADLDGRKEWGIVWLAKKNWSGTEALASVGDRVFASSSPEQQTIWEVDPATGKNWLVLEKKDIPAGKLNTEPRPPCANPVGLRVVGGRKGVNGDGGELFVTDIDGKEPRTYVFAPGQNPGDPIKLLRVIPVRPWGLAWLPDGRCVAAMDKTIGILDPLTGAAQPLVTTGLSAPFGIATDAKGRIYVSDQGNTGDIKYAQQGQLQWRALRAEGESSQQVKIFDAQGHLLHAIGKKGGQQPGRIDPESFWQPAGIAIDRRGRLWVTEFTTSPKRVTVWEIPDNLTAAAPKLTRQFIGPAAYGGGAAIIDPAKPWELMDTNYGVVFNVNLTSGTYTADRLPWRPYDPWKENVWKPDLPFMGKPSMVFPLDGRQFAVCNGGYGHGPEAHWEPFHANATGPIMIGEYQKDLFKPLAAIGNIRMWLRGRELMCRREDQWLPPVILEAARKLPDWPKYAAEIGMAPDASDVPHVVHQRNNGIFLVSKWPREISGFIWTDANNDQKVQADEIRFGDFPDTDVITFDSQLNAYIASDRKPDLAVYKVRRNGFNSNGAPVYGFDAVDKIPTTGYVVDHVADDGSMLSPGALHSADGKLLWSYPIMTQRLRSLGGSVRASLQPGRMYSVNTMQGVANGPGNLGPVYMVHSIDGMSYFLTRDDGLFITMMFRPYQFGDNIDTIPQAKPGMLLDKYTVGEESFNGQFSQAAATGQGFEKGHYYMTGLSRSMVVELTGLDSVERFQGGSVALVRGAGLYGKNEHLDPAATSDAMTATQPVQESVEAVPVLPGMDAFHGKPAQFATANVWLAWDKRGLLMKWHVEGSKTMFANNEMDWTRAFTTGDVCDLQIKSPTLGRCRYIMTMNDGKPVVIRFRYDGKDNGQGAVFRSGIAETHVPVVEKLNITPGVRRGKNDYFLQAIIPWDVLGIQPKAGLSVPMELGVFYSDPSGHKTAAREYWHSHLSGMVSDVPTEAQITPNWGTLELK